MSNLKAALYRFDKALHALEEAVGKVQGISRRSAHLQDQIGDLKADRERFETERARMEDDYKEEIAAMVADRERLEVAHQERIDALQDDQVEKDLRRQKAIAQLEQDHAEAIKALEEKHAAKLADYEASQTLVETDVDGKIAEATAGRDSEIVTLRKELEGLKGDRERLEREMSTMKAENEMLEGLTDQVTGQLDVAIKEIRTILEQ